MKTLLIAMYFALPGTAESEVISPLPKVFLSGASVKIEPLGAETRVHLSALVENTLPCSVDKVQVGLDLFAKTSAPQGAPERQRTKPFKVLRGDFKQRFGANNQQSAAFNWTLAEPTPELGSFALTVHSYALVEPGSECVDVLSKARTYAESRAFVNTFALAADDQEKRELYTKLAQRDKLDTYFRETLSSHKTNFKTEAAMQAMLYSTQGLSIVGAEDASLFYRQLIEELAGTADKNYFELFKLQQLQEKPEPGLFSQTLPPSIKDMREAIHFSSLEHQRLWQQRNRIRAEAEKPQVVRNMEEIVRQGGENRAAFFLGAMTLLFLTGFVFMKRRNVIREKGKSDVGK